MRCENAGGNGFEMSVVGPHLPTLEFCDDFSVGSWLNPQFPSQVRGVPTFQTVRISAQQITYGLASPAGFLPALCSS